MKLTIHITTMFIIELNQPLRTKLDYPISLPGNVQLLKSFVIFDISIRFNSKRLRTALTSRGIRDRLQIEKKLVTSR